MMTQKEHLNHEKIMQNPHYWIKQNPNEVNTLNAKDDSVFEKIYEAKV